MLLLTLTLILFYSLYSYISTSIQLSTTCLLLIVSILILVLILASLYIELATIVFIHYLYSTLTFAAVIVYITPFLILATEAATYLTTYLVIIPLALTYSKLLFYQLAQLLGVLYILILFLPTLQYLQLFYSSFLSIFYRKAKNSSYYSLQRQRVLITSLVIELLLVILEQQYLASLRQVK